MEYRIRKMKEQEYPLLRDFLYEAIFQPDENNLVSKDIIERPELRVYIEGFGSDNEDFCFCAEVEGTVIGAVWVRNIKGYGSIDDHTPEIAISIYKQYRGCGIGTSLMECLLEYLRGVGCPRVSLSVQKENVAYRLYQKVGFRVMEERDEEYLMLYEFAIREVNEKDWENLMKLYMQLHDNPMPEKTERQKQIWKQIGSDPNHHIIVAVQDGKIVSSCVCVIIPNLTHGQRPYAFVENVITDQDYRNKGYATQCLNYAKDIAFKENCYKMMLLTGSKKESTLKFYEQAGYNRKDKTAFIQWL